MIESQSQLQSSKHLAQPAKHLAAPLAKRLIVALDFPTAEQALSCAEQLAPLGVTFKIGMQLFYQAGMTIVDHIQARQQDPHALFLDLKLHDIPNTVSRAAESLVRHGVGFFNVHTLGGEAMMREAAQAAQKTAQSLGRPKPIVIGVTVLTSHSAEQLKANLKVEMPLTDYTVHLAKLAKQAGLDGVVCSPQEAERIHAACGSDFLTVTPGIRPADHKTGSDDQARILTPAQAIAASADYLVVGRPITAAPHPVQAAQQILAEIQQAGQLS